MRAALLPWADDHRAVALDLVRIYLGLGLAVRGAVFLADPGTYTALLPGGAGDFFAAQLLAHYVGLAHLAGGLLLALGVLTRLAAVVQLPILAGAAFGVHLPADGPLSQSFAFAALVLVLLVVIAVWGSGPWSLDQAVGRWTAAREDAEAEAGAASARAIRGRERPAPAPARSPARGAEADEPGCTCGHGRDHPHVTVERDYAGLRGLRFLTGTHARPSRVTFRCADCGGVVDVVDDAETLDAFRFGRAE